MMMPARGIEAPAGSGRRAAAGTHGCASAASAHRDAPLARLGWCRRASRNDAIGST